MKIHFKKYSLSIILGLIMLFSTTRLVWGWTNPTQNPTGGSGAVSVNSGGDVLISTTSPMIVTGANGKVGIGTTNPTDKFLVAGNDAASLGATFRAYRTDVAGVYLKIQQARGTQASPTIVSSGDTVGILRFDGYDGSSYDGLAAVSGQVDGTPGANDMPGALIFSTTLDGASGVSERMRIKNDGKVGIGTTNPAVPLHVVGNTMISSDSGNLQFTGADLVTDEMSLNYLSASHDLNIRDNNATTNRVTFQRAGNVGIASTTPWGLLSVNPNGITGPAFVIGSSTATNFIVTNGGKVGIGTTAPSNILHLYGSVAGVFQEVIENNSSDTAARTRLLLRQNGNDRGVFYTDGNVTYIQSAGASTDFGFTSQRTFNFNASNASSGNIIFKQGSNVVMQILANGKIGIGTTTPYSLLSLSNSVSTAANTPLFTIASTTAGTATSTLMTVLANGNTGIGLTSPESKLQVAGRIYQSGLGGSTYLGYTAGKSDDLTNRYNTGIGFEALYTNISGFENTALGAYALENNISGYDNTGLGMYALFNATGNENTAIGYESFYSNSTGSGNIGIGNLAGRYEMGSNAFYVNNQDRTNSTGDKTKSLLYGVMAADSADQKLTINASVGVGTTTPYSLLSLSNSVSTAANTPLFTIASTTAGTATSTLMTVLANGNTGIGLTNPVYNLDVAGDVNITGSFRVNGSVLSSGIGGSGTASYIPKFNTGTTLANSIIYESSGKVGIGTTAPAATLHIQKGNGTTDVSDSNSVVQLESDTNATNWWFNVPTSASGGTNATFGFATAGTIRHALTYNVTNNYLALTNDGANGAPTTGVIVDSTGKVGIGITNPGQTLTVNGGFVYSMTQNNVTASREMTTVYHNTTGKIMYVNASFINNGSVRNSVNIYCDANASPSTVVAGGSQYNGLTQSIFFIVLPDYYYKATTDGTIVVYNWIEWY